MAYTRVYDRRTKPLRSVSRTVSDSLTVERLVPSRARGEVVHEASDLHLNVGGKVQIGRLISEMPTCHGGSGKNTRYDEVGMLLLSPPPLVLLRSFHQPPGKHPILEHFPSSS